MSTETRTYSKQLAKSGIDCTDCECPYDECTNRVLDDHRPCCWSCSSRDTHDERSDNVNVDHRLLTKLAARVYEETTSVSKTLPFANLPAEARQGYLDLIGEIVDELTG